MRQTSLIARKCIIKAENNLDHVSWISIGFVALVDTSSSMFHDPKSLPFVDNIPKGWLICDNTELKIEDYPDLHMAIGTTYGGDGIRSFRLPDFRGDLNSEYVSPEYAFNPEYSDDDCYLYRLGL